MTLRTIRFAFLPALCALATAGAWAQDKAKDPAAKAPATKVTPAAPKKDAAPAAAPAAKPTAAPAAKDAAPAPAADSGMSDKQKTSYAVGVQFGKAIADATALIDLEALSAGMKDAMEKKQIKLDEAEVGKLLQSLQKQIVDAKKVDGEKFLAENATKEGVKTLPSGLQYKVITEGTGRTPKATDTVQTNYRGTFVNGTEFDSSYKRNEPAEFPVNRVIAGWTEALQLMKEGAKWELYVPYAMAYGEQGRPPAIPPYSVLVFQVELLKIVEATPPAAADGSKPVLVSPKAAPVTAPPAPVKK